MQQASRVAAVQMNSGNDVAANLAAARAGLERAAGEGAVLAVLPENFAFMGARERDKLAQAEADGNGPIQEFLAASAQHLGLWIVAGTVPLAVPGDPDHVYAAQLVYAADGARAARYDKIHLFDVDLPARREADGTERKAERYRESNSIAYGAPQPRCVATPAGVLGLAVCYDLRFPELFRALAEQGAEILLVPSAFTAKTGAAHWELLLRARAVENQCYLIAPGQCGTHPGGRNTWGHSMIVDPWGTVLSACGTEPDVVVAPLDPAQLESIRLQFPSLKHRRLP